MAGTVEFKNLPTGDIRLWSSREPVVVTLPVEGEGIPESVTITPMTHRDAEVRDQYKNAVAIDELERRIKAGVGSKIHAKFALASKEMHKKIEKLDKESDEYQEITTEFMAEWGDLSDNLRLAKSKNPEDFDSSPEGRLLKNTQYTIDKYCVSLNFGDSRVEIKAGDSEKLSPAFIEWIVTQIEKESYLSGEDQLGL
ncbi:MAG: hypothetical protein GY774_00295 [Planctomycetes bacterium]|nr:hypothetical protein [Planctomycetota bacterium]